MTERLQVRVQPKSSSEKVVLQNDGSYKVYTNKPALDGEANKQLILLIAEYFNVKRSQAIIVTGHKSRKKIVEIRRI